MWKRALTYCLLYTIIFGPQLMAQKASKVDLKELDRYFEKMVDDWDVPSASIGIVKDDKLIFTGNYGTKEVGTNTPPNQHTLYAIASNSKAFTSAMIGMLVEEGKLNWNDKVQKHLPWFELSDPYRSREATIRDILSHRVGLGTFSGDVVWYKSDLEAEEIIRRAKHIPMAFDFRAGYGYSNLMYITAGLIIEEVTGKSWSQNVKERIFTPLNMDRSITSIKDLDKVGNYATPHGRKEDKNMPIRWEDWENIAAMGGIISNVDDISKWMIANMNHGIVGQDTLFGKQTRNMVWTPHNNFVVDQTSSNATDRHFSGYGLGWGLSDYHGRMRVGHTGGYDGMLTAVTMIPQEKLGIVVLTNGMRSPFMAATYHALDQFLNVDTDRDWSEYLLKRTKKSKKSDTRVSNRIKAHVEDTPPTFSHEQLVGTYYSDIYGEIKVIEEKGLLRLKFEHSEALSATLSHWHYDVWKINWDYPMAWLEFGTVKFTSDNQMKITGMSFDVPNDDIFFEELKPYRK